MASKSTTDLLIELAVAKNQLAVAVKRKADVEEALVAALRAKGDKSVSVTIDGSTVKGTLVEGTRVSINADRLKIALPLKTWNKVTKRVLDNAMLEAAVAMKEVDPNIVADCSVINDVSPYIRVSGAEAVAQVQPVNKNGVAARRVVKAKKSA